VTEYEWDHRNRLVGVTEKDDMSTTLSTIDYSYDAFNRLVRRTYDDDGPGGNAATEQFWSYDGGSINAVLDFAGTEDDDLAHRNLWAEAVDQILATEDVTSLTSAGNIEWPLADHQGTVRDVADLNEGSGATSVTNHLTFDAFGILTAETNGSVEFAFGFMGKPHDDATGLIYFFMRWYDPILGKWIGEDPITFGAGDPNIVRVVGNNAVNLTDPTGLEGESVYYSPQMVFDAENFQAYGEHMQSLVHIEGTSESSWSWGGFVPSYSTVQGFGLMVAFSPLLAATGTTWTDIGYMLADPVPVSCAAYGGLTDGQLILANNGFNIATQGSIAAMVIQGQTPLDAHVDSMVAEGGPLYAAADWIGWGSLNLLLIAGTFAALPAASPQPLVHLTTGQNAAGINATTTLIGNTYAGPLSNAQASGIGITVRTGLSPSTYQAAVRIPDIARPAFTPVRPVGPLTTWQYMTGQHYTANGVLNLSTGAFTRLGVNTNQVLIYSVDVLLDITVATSVGAGIYHSLDQ
jgi:RHS repeat-associated protein